MGEGTKAMTCDRGYVNWYVCDVMIPRALPRTLDVPADEGKQPKILRATLMINPRIWYKQETSAAPSGPVKPFCFIKSNGEPSVEKAIASETSSPYRHVSAKQTANLGRASARSRESGRTRREAAFTHEAWSRPQNPRPVRSTDGRKFLIANG